MSPRLLLALLLAVVALGGCGQTQDNADAGGNGGADGRAADVDGRTFLSTGVTPRALVSGTRIRLTFDGDSVSANAGCNTLSGQARIDGGRLQATGAFGSTEMGCEQPLMDQDSWLAHLLGSGPAATLAGDVLTLSSDDGTVIELTDRTVVAPDRPLTGTKWQLEGTIEGSGPDGVVSSVPEGVTATLSITVDGEYEVYDGCNQQSGRAEVGDGVFTLKSGDTTLTGCGPEMMRRAIDAVSEVGKEITYTIEADQLTLTNGTRGLIYRAEG